MSLGWQLLPLYGNPDTIGILRDVDLVIGLLQDNHKTRPICEWIRDRIFNILANNPEKWATLRNKLYKAKDGVVKWGLLNTENRKKLDWIDIAHVEYHNLMIFRQLLETDPDVTLKKFIDSIEDLLKEFPLDKENIFSVSEKITKTDEWNFLVMCQEVESELGYVGIVSFCEGCIAEWKCINSIISYAQEKREKLTQNKAISMEYWDFTNIINIASTKKHSTEVNETVTWWKSFVLSGGGGNAFAQLAIIQKYVMSWGTVRSLSGTSMWAMIAILVWSIGNNPVKLRELMDDFALANEHGEIPEKLVGKELQTMSLFERLREKYNIKQWTKFRDLALPVVVNVWRQYKWWEQEIIMGWDEEAIPSVLASMNVPSPIKNNNTWALWATPIHGINMIDYAANERWNPTHWLELIWEKQKDLIDIDVWYSSENWWSAFVRRLFQRALLRDFFAKLRISNAGWVVMDMPLLSWEWYLFPKWAVERFFQIWESAFEWLQVST